MIAGVVGPLRRSAIDIEVIRRDGLARSAEVYVDTRFSGDLTLPKVAMERLSLLPNDAVNMQIGDGAYATFTTYQATILWRDAPREITVLESEIWPVAGTGLPWHNNLSIDFTPGGDVAFTGL